MKKQAEQNRVTEKASHTALMAAIHRFMATKESRTAFVGPDHLAHIFMPFKARFFLSKAFFRRIFRNNLNEKVPGSYEYVSARTKFFDEVFIQAAKEKIPQIVLLGAGYDTRAIRFQDLVGESRIFEVDVPTTQQEKQKRLRRHKIHTPEKLAFVPVNFNTDKLENALLSAGYDPEKKTLFLWEGVTMYITAEAVDETLAFIANKSGSGSRLAFDYFYQSVIDGTSTAYGADKLSGSASELGEGFKFGIVEGEIENFLAERGFSIVRHYSSEEFEKEYLKDGSARLGKMYGFAGIVYAEKKYST